MKLEFSDDAYIFGKIYHKGDVVEVPDNFKPPKEYGDIFVPHKGDFVVDDTPKRTRKPKEDPKEAEE